MEEIKGKIHVLNSHLESAIERVIIPTAVKTTAAQIVQEALIKFDLVVSQSIPIVNTTVYIHTVLDDRYTIYTQYHYATCTLYMTDWYVHRMKMLLISAWWK